MANTIKKTNTLFNIISNNDTDVGNVKSNKNINLPNSDSMNFVEDLDLNESIDNNLVNDDSNVTYELTSNTSTDNIDDYSSNTVQDSKSVNVNSTTEVSNSNSSGETNIGSVQNGIETASSNNNNKNNSETTTSVPNGVDSATINSNKNSNNNEMSQSSMNDGNGVNTSSNPGNPLIGSSNNIPPVSGENTPNSGNSSVDSSSDGKNVVNKSENGNGQNINNNGDSSSAGGNVSSSENNPDGEWEILPDEEYLKIYQELLDSIEKQIGTDGEISVLLREIRLKYVNTATMDVDDGFDELSYERQAEEQIQAHIDEVDQYVRDHSDYNSYAELMQSKAEFENNKLACEQMIKYYTDKPIWEEYYNKLEIAKKEMPPQTGIVGERGLKGDPINTLQRLDSYEEQLIELFGENYKEVFAQYGLDLDFDYVQLYNYIYENEGPAAAEKFYEFAEDNIKSLAGLVSALEDSSFLLSKDEWYSPFLNIFNNTIMGIGDGFESSIEGVMKWVQENPEKTVHDYSIMWYMLMLQTNEYGPSNVLSIIYEAGQGVGQMFPSIAIAALIGFLCPEGLALPMGIALESKTVAEIGASAYLFASTGGRDYAEQMQNGMSRKDAILHGIATGGLDVTSEKLLGGLSVFGHESPTSLKKLFISMIKEGGQEVAQDVLSELLHLGGELPNFNSKEEMIEYFKEKGNTFIVAALSAGEIEGPGAAISIHNISEVYNFIDTGSISEADLANMIRAAVKEDLTNLSDAEVIGKYNEACLSYVNQMKESNETETNQEVIESSETETNQEVIESKETETNQEVIESKETETNQATVSSNNEGAKSYFWDPNDMDFDESSNKESKAQPVIDSNTKLKEYQELYESGGISLSLLELAEKYNGDIPEEELRFDDFTDAFTNKEIFFLTVITNNGMVSRYVADAEGHDYYFDYVYEELTGKESYFRGKHSFDDAIGCRYAYQDNEFNALLSLPEDLSPRLIDQLNQLYMQWCAGIKDLENVDILVSVDTSNKNYKEYNDALGNVGKGNEVPTGITYKNMPLLIDYLFNKQFDEVMNITEENLPDGFDSVEEYKKSFVDQLIETEYFNHLTNEQIVNLCKDPVIFRELVLKTDIVENSFIKLYLYEENYNYINSVIFSNVSLNDISLLLDKPGSKQYLESLSPSELSNFMSALSTVYGNNIYSHSAFMDILCSYDISQLNEFIGIFGSIGKLFDGDLSGQVDIDNMVKFLNHLSNDIYTEDNLSNIDKLKKIFRLLPSIYEVNNESVKNAYNELLSKNNTLENTIRQTIVNSSSTDLSINDGVYSISDGSEKVDIEFEVNGEKIIKTESVNDGKVDLYDIVSRDSQLLSALCDGTLKINNISINESLSKYVLSSKDGLGYGINYVTYMVNGETHTCIVYDTYYDFSKDYAGEDFHIINVESLGSINYTLTEDDLDKIYEVKYTIDGKEQSFYLSPYRTFSGRVVLDLETYINDNNLVGAKNFEISEVNKSDLLSDSIIDSTEFDSIISEDSYGGNQEDVYDLVDKYINHSDSITDIEKAEAEILVNMIRDTFPNATDEDIVDIADSFSESGCMYMAVANAFASYVSNMENGEQFFKDNFGFDLTVNSGNNSKCNLNLLALDIFLSYAGGYCGTDISKIGNLSGINKANFDSSITDYFAKKGISVDHNYIVINSSTNNNNAVLSSVCNDPGNSYYLYSGRGFSLEFDDSVDISTIRDQALEDSTIENNTIHDIGSKVDNTGHVMLITGIDADGNIIVSTWGEKAKVIPGDDGLQMIETINFSMNNTESSDVNVNDNSSDQVINESDSDVVIEKLAEDNLIMEKDLEITEELSNISVFNMLSKDLETLNDDIIENVKVVCDEIGFDYTNAKIIGYGETSITLDVGDQIIKISCLPVNQDMINETDGLVAKADNLKTIKVNNSDSVNIYTMEKLDTSNITEEDVSDMFCKLREKGYVWGDLKTDNLGRNSNGDIQLLDYGQIFKEGSHDADFILNNVIDPELVKKSEKVINENTNADNSSIDSVENGIEIVSRDLEIDKMCEMKELALPVAELMKNDPSITFEQGKTLSEIYFNDNTIEVQYIVPSLAEDVLRLQRMAMEEGMTLKEYGNQKSESTVSPEVQLEADTLAKSIRISAEMKEPRVTEDMKSLEKNGNYLAGLDKNLKSVESLSRKIISDANKKNISLETAASDIGDSIRYTLICSEDTFTEDVRSSLLELQRKGYKIEKYKNKFNETYYHGINVNLLTPDNTIIELQFHTEQSFLAKGEMTHLYYEIARNDFTTQEAKDLANEIQEGITKLVPQPDGVLDLKEESVTLKE